MRWPGCPASTKVILKSRSSIYWLVFLKILLAISIIGICISTNFDMTYDSNRIYGKQGYEIGFTFSWLLDGEEGPCTVAYFSKIALSNPSCIFIVVSPSCPAPKSFKDEVVNMAKGFLGAYTTIIIAPIPGLPGWVPVSFLTLDAQEIFRILAITPCTELFDGVMISFSPCFLRWRIFRSIRMWFNIHSWSISSKQARISASRTYRDESRLERQIKHCSIASAQDRYSLNP